MPNGDLKPDVQAEDFRVYRTVADLDSQVVEDVNGYKIARLLRNTFASVFSNDVRQMFSKRGIDAVGFEIAVDAQDGAGGAPLLDVQGAIGLQAVVFTDPHPDSSPGPHVYAFAKQGEGGIEPMDEGLRGDFGKFSATFFVAHFRGDAKATSAIWEAGLSYCEGTGLLSGTAYLRARHENEVIRGRQDMWLVTTVELSLKYGWRRKTSQRSIASATRASSAPKRAGTRTCWAARRTRGTGGPAVSTATRSTLRSSGKTPTGRRRASSGPGSTTR